ncbi:MAG: thioredoxin family protein [Candidatus Aminicenantes bacterium]|nr:thioredoxin family protein [Candidatus Aminicenantes bacterium]
MICPQCHLFTPDTGFKCIHCGAIVKKLGPEAGVKRYPASQPGNSFFRSWMLLPLAMLAVLVYLFFAQQNKTKAINGFDPGNEFDIESYVQKGKITIFDFFSDYCPPCRQISPLLKKLDEQRPDLVVLAVDINRKGVKGIDFYSPLARQYQLNAVPHFKIFNAEGNLVSEGQQAYGEVIQLLYQAGIQ